MKFLVAYDIADPKRLRRVGRFWEKHALRCQKSVFLADVTQERLMELLDEVAKIISLEEDIVQAFKLPQSQPQRRLARGTTVPLHPACVVHAGGVTHVVDGENK